MYNFFKLFVVYGCSFDSLGLLFIWKECLLRTFSFQIFKKGGENMAKSKVTSKKAATAASKVLRSKRASKAAKTAAGSALSQRPSHKKHR